MVTDNHYRWDFIGLSTDQKPGSDNPKVTDGSTFYCSDNSKLYVWYKNQWYEKTATGGGGSSYTAGDGIDITDNTISVDTETIQEKLTAGTGIDITDNTISATGGGGGGINSVTRADYNYPTDNPYGIAAWQLEDGMYKNTDENYVEICYSTSYTHRVQPGDCFVVMRQGFGVVLVIFGTDSYNNLYYTTCRSDGTVGQEFSALNLKRIINELTYTSSGCALDARQGKALKDLIDALDVRVTALGG